MTTQEVLNELEGYADERTKSTYLKHGAREPFYGVKVQDLKKIMKKVKKDHELALDLYSTGNTDAMYLAGLIADETQMTREDLNQWADEAYWYYLSEYVVPWVAAESPYGFELGLKWIDSPEERIASAGWATLAYYAGVNSDENLDITVYSQLLERAGDEVHNARNRVRYVMNGFVISIGSYIISLTDKAKQIGSKIGKVSVDMGGTACKVPLANEYIEKVEKRGSLGKKRKTARC